MKYYWASTVEKFLNEDVYKEISKYSNNIKQLNAWKSSISYLKKILDDERLKELFIILEYNIPLTNERVDAVILGKSNNKTLALLIEMKGWRNFKPINDIFVESDLGKTIHPEYQLLNYLGKMRYSFSEADCFDFKGIVVMYNSNSIEGFNIPVFFKEDDEKLKRYLKQLFTEKLDENEINRFLNATYSQNKNLFEAIKRYYNEISSKSHKVLAEDGFGLSESQIKLLYEILDDLESKRKIVYLINGKPGSGKTLVAIHLLLNALKNNYRAILCYRNNRLINSLREIFNSIKPGLSSVIKFYSTGRGFGVAEDKFKGYFDLVIYDEAQRMSLNNIKAAIKRGRVVVFFYDEGQILNAEEEGTTENFINVLEDSNVEYKLRTLNSIHRIPESYANWVEELLKNPNTKPNFKDYDFRVVDSIEELLELLKAKNKKALIAAFTESPGDFSNPYSIKNLRIGYPLYSGFDLYKNFNKRIYWLMHPKNDYVPFWVYGECNRLNRCASIYGCQGFECDYIGLIWGRDLVIRVLEDGKAIWVLGEECQDNVGNPSLKELMKSNNKDDRKLAMKLLINRYRIFLTRGIKGTYVFCEDEETRKFLKDLFKQ
jgi:DUF2075 family protein